MQRFPNMQPNQTTKRPWQARELAILFHNKLFCRSSARTVATRQFTLYHGICCMHGQYGMVDKIHRSKKLIGCRCHRIFAPLHFCPPGGRNSQEYRPPPRGAKILGILPPPFRNFTFSLGFSSSVQNFALPNSCTDNYYMALIKIKEFGFYVFPCKQWRSGGRGGPQAYLVWGPLLSLFD